MAEVVEEATIDGDDGDVSDESSFYGDEEDKKEWKARLLDFDERDHWDTHDKQMHVMAFRNRPTITIKLHDHDGHVRDALTAIGELAGSTVPALAPRREAVPLEESTVHSHAQQSPRNPLEGRDNAKQLQESAADFLKRAPPLNSHWSEDGWLWAANPYAKAREDPPDVDTFTEIGRQYLDDYLERRSKLEAKFPDKAVGVITRMLKPDRDSLKADIEQLAVTHHVTNGKWMLFPHVNSVPQTWRSIVEAVTENRLGDMVKIATGSNKDPDDGLRVICVYTHDFTHDDDVKRVCRALDELGLIPAERSIFYKADAYTYLNITSDNRYNIPASLYSSKDVLGKIDAGKSTKRPPTPASLKGKEPAKKKQATLDWTF